MEPAFTPTSERAGIDGAGAQGSPADAFVRAQERVLARYGVAAESRFVDAPSIGGRAHVLAAGEGPPVLLLNGIGTPGAMWAPLLAELGGLRLLAVDLPGFGLTDGAPHIADALRAGMVQFVDDVRAGLGLERFAVVGSSLGSLVACWLALDRPERVTALLHVGCPALALGTSAPLPMRLLSVRPLGRLLTRLQPPSPRQVEDLSRMVGEHPLAPEVADVLLATERLPHFRDSFLATLRALVRLRGGRPDVRLTADQLAEIAQPTLLFWGRDDPFGTSALGERVAAALPRAELHVVDGGHCPWLTQAARIAPVAARFLQEQP